MEGQIQSIEEGWYFARPSRTAIKGLGDLRVLGSGSVFGVSILLLTFATSPVAMPGLGFDAFVDKHTSARQSNADSCQSCHFVPSAGGSSKLTVTRAGRIESGRFTETPGGGLLHTRGGVNQLPKDSIIGLRVSTNLLGAGYVEAVPDAELRRIAVQETAQTAGRIHGQVANATALESPASGHHAGRFGWKSQHSSLYSFAADSLANELGVPNALYPLDSGLSMGKSSVTQTRANPIPDQSQTLRDLTSFLRSTEPIDRDATVAGSAEAVKGERIFQQIGCAVCHVPSLKSAPPGSLLPDGSRVSERLGGKTIHPYSDFLLHDVGTGDGIVQRAAPQDADQTTANKFRTAPLWGVRYRSWLMHDGKSVTYHQAIERHEGEASEAVRQYDGLIPSDKHALREFLNSL